MWKDNARIGFRAGSRAGQSLVEACLSIFLVGLIFSGLFQLSRILAAREVLTYAAACGARAKTVGFNQWMVAKVVRVAAAANAGRLVTPEFENRDDFLRRQLAELQPGLVWSRLLSTEPVSAQYEVERGRIPEYLDSPNAARARHVLDYEDWDSIRHAVETVSLIGPGELLCPEMRVEVSQKYPLRCPMHRAFYADDFVRLADAVVMESHYPLYIDDEQR